MGASSGNKEMARANMYAADQSYKATQDTIASNERMNAANTALIKEQDARNEAARKDAQSKYTGYMDTGNKANAYMTQALDDPNSWYNSTFNADQMYNDPGYQKRLEVGNIGLTKSLAAGSGLLGGAALKAATEYNQDFAANEYGNAYNRFTQDKNNRFNMLNTLIGNGLNATGGYAGNAYQTNSGSELSNLNSQTTQWNNQAVQNNATNQANLAMANAKNKANSTSPLQGALGGAAQGFAMGGPWGALAGGVIGGVTSLI